MHIMLLSINHHTARVALREKLAMNGPLLEQTIDHFRRQYPSVEIVVLSTCNRTELYLVRPPLEAPSIEQAISDLSRLSGVDEPTLRQAVLSLENEPAIAHLFRVATGLESMVLGEPQILGQVKRAYESATAQGAVGPVFHRVFQQAIGVAKRVRTTTGIDTGRISIGSAAVDFAKQIFERFDDKTIVGVGAGEMAEPMLRNLISLKPARLWLTNRSLHKAQAIVSQLGIEEPHGGARPFDELDDLLMEADIVLASTGATEPVLTVKQFKPVLRRRRFRPLFLIDIAVPRDVEPAVGELTNVYLYNIDDLQQVVDQTQQQRHQEASTCETMLDDAVRSCIGEVQNRDIGQMIRNLRRRLQGVGALETDRIKRKMAACRPDELEEKMPQLIDEHTHRLINKILHMPLSQLEKQRPEATLGFYAAALRVLFGLGEDQPSLDHQDVEASVSSPLQVDDPQDQPVRGPSDALSVARTPASE